MSSLPDLQRRFAAELAAVTGARDPGIAVYRNTVRANYRNALGATFSVVCAVIGDATFAAAVDAFASAHQSAGGDLNVYGGEFAQFQFGALARLSCHRASSPPWTRISRICSTGFFGRRRNDGGEGPSDMAVLQYPMRLLHMRAATFRR